MGPSWCSCPKPGDLSTPCLCRPCNSGPGPCQTTRRSTSEQCQQAHKRWGRRDFTATFPTVSGSWPSDGTDGARGVHQKQNLDCSSSHLTCSARADDPLSVVGTEGPPTPEKYGNDPNTNRAPDPPVAPRRCSATADTGSAASLQAGGSGSSSRVSNRSEAPALPAMLKQTPAGAPVPAANTRLGNEATHGPHTGHKTRPVGVTRG